MWAVALNGHRASDEVGAADAEMLPGSKMAPKVAAVLEEAIRRKSVIGHDAQTFSHFLESARAPMTKSRRRASFRSARLFALTLAPVSGPAYFSRDRQFITTMMTCAGASALGCLKRKRWPSCDTAY